LSAQEILNRLRAFTPWPGVFTFLDRKLLKIWKMEIAEESAKAGKILSADKNGIVVACGKNALQILELQLEGGRRMSAQEFLAGHSLNRPLTFE
jgi:methionyl-tRNA formyltransferase